MLRLYGRETQENPGWGCGREGHGLGQPGFHRSGDWAACAWVKPGALVLVLAWYSVYAGYCSRPGYHPPDGLIPRREHPDEAGRQKQAGDHHLDDGERAGGGRNNPNLTKLSGNSPILGRKYLQKGGKNPRGNLLFGYSDAGS